MALFTRMRIGVFALMVLGGACSSSDSGSSNGGGNKDDESNDSDGLDGINAETDDPKKDAAVRMDAKVIETPPAADAGDAGTPVITLPDGGLTFGDAAITKPDAAIVNSALTPLPHDGERGSICYADGDCKGDDLKCQLPAGSAIPGFCVDDCQADTDCAAIGGVKGTCPPLVGGLCEYPCGGASNDGKGKCPDDMLCTNTAVGVTAALFPNWRCRYPEGGGKKTEGKYEQCVQSHQGGDCEGLSWCAQPVLSAGSIVFTQGYCSPICTKDTDCKAGEDVTAHVGCNLFTGMCEFDCSNKGARCPVGMNCLDIDQLQTTSTLRCVFID